MSRLTYIKNFYDKTKYLDTGDIDWLINQAEKIEQFEMLLKEKTRKDMARVLGPEMTDLVSILINKEE